MVRWGFSAVECSLCCVLFCFLYLAQNNGHSVFALVNYCAGTTRELEVLQLILVHVMWETAWFEFSHTYRLFLRGGAVYLCTLGQAHCQTLIWYKYTRSHSHTLPSGLGWKLGHGLHPILLWTGKWDHGDHVPDPFNWEWDCGEYVTCCAVSSLATSHAVWLE